MSDDPTAPGATVAPNEICDIVGKFPGVEGVPTVRPSGGRTVIECRRRSKDDELDSVEIVLSQVPGSPEGTRYCAEATNHDNGQDKRGFGHNYRSALDHLKREWHRLDR